MKREQTLLLRKLQEILQTVKSEKQVNLARLKTLSILILAIISLQTVNLAKLSCQLKGSENSRYKKLQRFMSYTWDKNLIAGIIYTLYKQISNQDKVRLSIDRTSWCFGRSTINFMLIGIVWNGCCLPLYWSLLDKKGISSSMERTELLGKVLKIIPINSITCLYADREFIGKNWIKWLNDQKLPFIIRVRNNLKVDNRQVKELFRGGQSLHHKEIMEARLWIAGKVLANDFIITVSNIPNLDYLCEYSHRWQIECLFGCLKTRGFDLETTHLSQDTKLDNLMSVLAIAYTWCRLTGGIRNETEPIKVKTHNRKSVSLFRYGLDLIRSILFNLVDRIREYRQVLKILWCT